jgi:sugar/nucleoside kinase (ribokinase family)
VKLGKRGALISKDGKVTSVDAEQVNAIDTTGAGDLWAAGFLFAYLEGEPLSVCGRLASLVASEVVQVMGPQIPEEGWFRIRRFFR